MQVNSYETSTSDSKFFFTNHLTYTKLQVYFAHTLLGKPYFECMTCENF